MSVANAFIGTTETILSVKNARPRAGHFFCASIRSRPPTGEQPEAASLTPLTLARCETAREARNSRDRLERQKHVEDLFAVTVLLHLGDLAAPAIGNARLRYLA